MDRQTKLLNKQYLETRLRELKEIRRKEITFDIEESDRAFSKSLYINFYIEGKDGKVYKTSTLRISDHLSSKCPHTQFIIEPNNYLEKKKKTQFMKAVELVVKKARIRFFCKEMEKITKYIGGKN